MPAKSAPSIRAVTNRPAEEPAVSVRVLRRQAHRVLRSWPIRRNDKYCIIGAGASGLAVAKNFGQRGIPFDCLEREADLGGLWNFATESGIVYETTHLVSAIYSTAYDDLPMVDEDYPAYPSHERVLGYFRDYVEKFGLAGAYRVRQSVDARRRARRQAVGRLGRRRSPPAHLSRRGGGERTSRRAAHADISRHVRRRDHPFARYKSPKQVRDKRVLVVGCGNSAADIVSDAVHGRSSVFMSIRRGYWFVPKFMMGFPTDDVVSWVEILPAAAAAEALAVPGQPVGAAGSAVALPLPDPDYSIDQAHPTMSDEIPRLSAHGKLTVKPDIASFDGNRVLFKDGTAETIDMIVFATGYQPVVPLHRREPDFRRRRQAAASICNVVHPEHEGPVRGGSRAGQRQHVAARRLPGPADRQPHRRRQAQAPERAAPLSRRAGERRDSACGAACSLPPTGIAWRRTITTIGAAEAADPPVRTRAQDAPRRVERRPSAGVASFAPASPRKKWPADRIRLLRRRGDVHAILAGGEIALRAHLDEPRGRALEQELHVARGIELIRLRSGRYDQATRALS